MLDKQFKHSFIEDWLNADNLLLVGALARESDRCGRTTVKACTTRNSTVMYKLREHQTVITAAAGVTVAVAGAYYVWRSRDRTPKAGPYTADNLPDGVFDALIVGAGPSGSTAAYYLARAGAKVCFLLPVNPQTRACHN